MARASDGELYVRTFPELLVICHKIAAKRGLLGVPEHAWIILQGKEELRQYVKRHYAIYEQVR